MFWQTVSSFIPFPFPCTDGIVLEPCHGGFSEVTGGHVKVRMLKNVDSIISLVPSLALTHLKIGWCHERNIPISHFWFYYQTTFYWSTTKGNSTVSSWEWTVTHQPSSTYTQTWATLTLEPEDQEYMQFSFNALGMKEWHLDLSFAFQEKLLNKYTILKSFRNFQKGLVYPQEKWHIHCSAELNITNSEYNNNN